MRLDSLRPMLSLFLALASMTVVNTKARPSVVNLMLRGFARTL